MVSCEILNRQTFVLARLPKTRSGGIDRTFAVFCVHALATPRPPTLCGPPPALLSPPQGVRFSRAPISSSTCSPTGSSAAAAAAATEAETEADLAFGFPLAHVFISVWVCACVQNL